MHMDAQGDTVMGHTEKAQHLQHPGSVTQAQPRHTLTFMWMVGFSMSIQQWKPTDFTASGQILASPSPLSPI